MGVQWDDEKEPNSPFETFLSKIPGIGSSLAAAQRAGSPQGFAGPGVLDQLFSAATGAKRGAFYNTTLPGTELGFDLTVGRGLPASSFLKRAAGNAIPDIIRSLVQGESPQTAVTKGGVAAGVGAVAEPVLGVLKQMGAQKLAGAARDEMADLGVKNANKIRVQDLVDQEAWEKAKSAVEGRNAAKKKTYETQLADRDAAHIQAKREVRAANQQKTQQYEQAVTDQNRAYEATVLSHQDMAAKSIMDDAKSLVPEWAELPSNLRGVVEITTGKGKALSQAAFEKAYTDAADAAVGHPIFLSPDDIGYFRLPVNKGGRANLVDGTTISEGTVDARDLIRAMNEKPFKNRDWQVYDRAQRALADQGLGIPAEAREAYKNAMGFADYIQNSGAIKDGTLDTNKLVKAMYDMKQIAAVRNRGMGDAYTGPFQVARVAPETPSGVPTPPPEIPKPVLEPPPIKSARPPKPQLESFDTPQPMKTEIGEPLTADQLGVVESIPIPGSPNIRGSIGAILGGALAGANTGMNPYHLGGAAATGWGVGHALPNEWITKAPGLDNLSNLLGELAKPYTAAGRDAVMQGLDTLGLFNAPDPAQEAAEIQARLDALKPSQ